MSDQIQNHRNPNWKGIAQVSLLVLGILGLGFCSCGGILTLTPFIAPGAWQNSSAGRPYTAGEAFIYSSICCFVPALMLFVAGFGIWFFFVRRRP